MPARRLDRGPLAVRLHDVLGLDADESPRFIGHVGLAAEERIWLSADDRLRITDMQPPLVREGGPVAISAFGTVLLVPREAEAIQLFLDRTENEYESASLEGARQYSVRPHRVGVTAEDDLVVAWRYSCGGFVLEAYRYAGIDLLVTEEASLPPVSLEVLRRAYSDEQQRRVLNAPGLRDRFLGLSGDGPWPIVLPGYLLNSLARTETEIRAGPYRARPGDEYFPAPTSP